jgi:hypothetical protein
MSLPVTTTGCPVAQSERYAVASGDQPRADTWHEFRDHLDGTNPDARSEPLFVECERVLTYSRHHWLEYDGRGHDRKALQEAYAEARAVPPKGWTSQQSELIFLLYVLGVARVGLEQVPGMLSTDAVSSVITTRDRLYRDALTTSTAGVDAQPRTLTEIAQELPAERRLVEDAYYRYSRIDGERWYRTEGLLPKSNVCLDELPGELLAELEVQPGDDACAATLRAVALRTIEKHGTLEPAVAATLRCAVRDPSLGVDHATITCPKQVRFPAREHLGERENIFRRTELREGLDLSEFEDQLGHASEVRLAKVIGARMAVLKLKASKQFFGSGCLGGEALEKSGDYMIFHHEDAHYPGHKNAGCSTGGRAPIPLVFAREGEAVDLPGIFADFRAVRLSHDEAARFDVAGLARVIQYSAWLGALLNTAYETGAVVSHD